MDFEFSQNFSIADCRISNSHPVFIIAEAGVSHFGSIEKAKALVDLAVSAKADAVKFQIFRTDDLISSGSEGWVERMRPKELPFEAFKEIQDYCRKKEIIFLATAHDEPSFEYLRTLDVPAYKIGSGEVVNWPFLKKIALDKKPVILSTGMYTLAQIKDALQVFRNAGNPELIVLHCVTSYPTPPSEVNLTAMATIRETCNVLTGYSDHTEGIHFPLAAVALGATVIEKHISLDFNVPNAQDWKVSCGPHDLPDLVRQIRDIQAGMGSGKKIPGESEKKSLEWARKSLVTTRYISRGETFNESMLTSKRPGNGISPAELMNIIGKTAGTNIKNNMTLTWEHLL